MARVTGTLTGTSYANSSTVSLGLLVFGGQPAPDAIAATTAYSLTASAGSVAVSGDNASLVVARRLAALAATFSITGDPATFAVARILSALAASYSVTGSQASLVLARILSVAPADYTISGDDATLVYTQTNAHVLDVAPGTITISGLDATLTAPKPKGGGQHGRGQIVDVDRVILRNDDEVLALVAALL